MATGIDNPDILAVLGLRGSPRDYAGSEMGAKPTGSSFQDVLNQQAVKQSEQNTSNGGREAAASKAETAREPSRTDGGSTERTGRSEPATSQGEVKGGASKKDSVSGQSEKTRSTKGNRLPSGRRNDKVIREKREGEIGAEAEEENREEEVVEPQCRGCVGQLPSVPQATTDSVMGDFQVVEAAGAGEDRAEPALLGEGGKAQRSGQTRPKITDVSPPSSRASSTGLEQNNPKTVHQKQESESASALSLPDKFIVTNSTEKTVDADRETTIRANKKTRSTSGLDHGQNPGQTRTVPAEADSAGAGKLPAVSGPESKLIEEIKTKKNVRKESETRDAGERVTAWNNEAGETARMKGRPASTPSLEQSSSPGREPLHLSQHDRVELVQRVLHAVRLARMRDGELRLRLHPPELGALRVELRVEGGALIARLEAESSAARDLLMENLPDLRQRLAEHRVRIERFDVTLMSQSNSGGGGQQHAASPHTPRPSGTRWTGQARGTTDDQEHSPRGARPINSLFDVIA